MKYEKFEKWMLGKKVTHMVTLSSGVIVDISCEGEPDFPVKVKYYDGNLAGETALAFLRNLEFLEGKTSDLVSAQEDSQVNWEVGQVVWDTAFGEGEVVDFDEEGYLEHPVKVHFKNGCTETYTKEGTIFKDCKRSLFFSEPVVTAELYPPKKPFTPTLKKGQMVVIKGKDCFEGGCIRYVHSEQEDRIYIEEDLYFLKKDIAAIHCVGEEIKFN